MNTHDGGAAFPRPGFQGDFQRSELGMSLRDYFAAKAMQGLYANPIWLEAQADMSENQKEQSSSTARTAYFMADAMLAERNKPNES